MPDLATEAPTVRRWEYQAVTMIGDALALMNQMGNDGWEMVCIIGSQQTPRGKVDIWLAKRPKTLISVTSQLT